MRGFQWMQLENANCVMFCFCKKCFKLHGPTSILEYQTHVRLRQNNSYNRYGEILFQKVASGYLLHFVQDGSQEHVLEKQFLRKHVKHIWILRKMPYIFLSNSRSTAPLRLNLREFALCNSRHPDPRRVWKGGSDLQSLRSVPLHPAANSQKLVLEQRSITFGYFGDGTMVPWCHGTTVPW